MTTILDLLRESANMSEEERERLRRKPWTEEEKEQFGNAILWAIDTWREIWKSYDNPTVH